MEYKGTCNHTIILRREGEIVYIVYGLSYSVAGATTATSVEVNSCFLKV